MRLQTTQVSSASLILVCFHMLTHSFRVLGGGGYTMHGGFLMDRYLGHSKPQRLKIWLPRGHPRMLVFTLRTITED